MMRVIGIDPAPKKDAAVCDEGRLPRRLTFPELQELLKEASQGEGGVLLCWDAPLSGPAHPDGAGPPAEGDFTIRPIERFFRRKDNDIKTPPPKGVSTLPYCSCYHWTVSRALLGLPRVGPYDAGWADLPFSLLPLPNQAGEDGKLVAEVHPALAIWLWCRGDWPPERGWIYKGNQGSREMVEGLWAALKDKLRPLGLFLADLEIWQEGYKPENDDELDAIVAWLLGHLWLRGGGEVMLLGDRASGSLLLPRVAGLESGFAGFLAKMTRRQAKGEAKP